MKPFVVLAVTALAGCRQATVADDRPDAEAPGPGPPDAAVCDNRLAPSGRKCIAPAGLELELAVVAKPLQFETGGDASEPLTVALHFGWEAEQVFPITCAPIARVEVAAGGVASFPPAHVQTLSGVLAPVVTGAGIVPSINDQRLPWPCPMDRCTVGSAAAPLLLRVLSRATYDGWLMDPGLASCDLATHGLAVVTFRDRERRPLAGVVPQRWFEIVLGNDPQARDLVAGQEVFFLASDRRTIEARTSTSDSGTVIIPLVESWPIGVTGRGGGVTFEPIGIAAVAGTVYFEQVDPQDG